MKFDPTHQSNDVDDERGRGGGPALGGGGLGLLIGLLLRVRYGWVILLVLGVGYAGYRVWGGGGGTSNLSDQNAPSAQLAPSDTDAHFVAFVLDDAQDFWDKYFKTRSGSYRHAKLTLFSNSIRTGCGAGDSATGPFYCPDDEHVYIDLAFFRVMSERLGANGQFARAYVIAHEIGHHVQKVSGETVGGGKGAQGNSVRTELQADCYAGIWARSADARGLLEKGDLDSALNAASRIGDDVLQKEETGHVRPESFTHGTAEQRKRWLQKGYMSGDLHQCDTFHGAAL